MIGDWVFDINNDIECQVDVKDFRNGGEYILDYYEPIQLTAEILEKNGFKFLMEDEKYKTLCLNEPYINCTFVKEFKDWMITAGAAGSLKKRFVEVSKVQFVHEMQQLLRLCGYDMDVVV
jgi:hypothetical protein